MEESEEIDAGPSEKFEQRWIRFAVVAVLGTVFVAFIADNAQSVKVGFLVAERTTPLYLVLLVTALLGAILGQVFSWWRRR